MMMDPTADPNQRRKQSLVDSLSAPSDLAPPTNTGISGIGLPGGMQAPPLQMSADSPAAIKQGANPNDAPAAITQASSLASAMAGPSVPPPPAGGLGQYANSLEGFDSAKLNSTHDSPKYQIGRALSQFDPRQGVTPDVLAALNKLGVGQFSGSGDKVSIANGDPRFEGVNAIDLVRGFDDPNGTGGWQYGAEGGPAAAPAPGPAGMGGAPPMQGGAALDGMLSGDPMAAIQAALAQQAGTGGKNSLQSLIAALGGR